MTFALFRSYRMSFNCRNYLSRNRFYNFLLNCGVEKPHRFKQLLPQYLSLRHYRYSSKPVVRNEMQHGSRYVPDSNVELAEEKIKDLLKDVNKLSTDKWEDLKLNLLDAYSCLTNVNVDSILMNVLLLEDKIDLAHSFMSHLKKINSKTNFMTHLKYMVLCGKHVETCGEESILSTFNKVKSHFDTYPVLDAKRVECLTQGLCATREWRLSREYIKKVHSIPTIETMNALACAAARNSDEVLLWEIIRNSYKTPDTIGQSVFEEYVRYLTNLNNSLKSDPSLLKLFDFLKKHNIIISEAVAKEIKKYFTQHRYKWQINHSKVSRPAQCSACKKTLEFHDLTIEEFKMLKDTFFKRAIKKSDIFINTTERELDNFLNFIDARGPFDVVLDGLNVAHTFHGAKTPWALANQLLHVVLKLSRPKRRLLVMGRHHMRFWPKSTISYIREKASMFFTDNISQDDPFVVYAALCSGPHTVVLSNDLLRDHLSRLDDPRYILLFRRWQEGHQVYTNVDEKGKIEALGPLEHNIRLQGCMESGWHIPYDDGVILEPYEELNNWLCIHRAINLF